MLRQSKASSTPPPTIGPRAIAAPVLAPHRPIASARSRRSVTTCVSSDSVAGNTIAAPTPITARAAISWPGLPVNPPARLARPKTARPASSMPLRPNRSERLPKASTDPANKRLNASTTHCSWALEASSWRTSVGSATLTIVVSMLIANAASSSKLLCDEDVLERVPDPQRPGRPKYVLTDKGRELGPALIVLLKWGDRHYPTPDGPPRLALHAACGGSVGPDLRCDRCGQPV